MPPRIVESCCWCWTIEIDFRYTQNVRTIGRRNHRSLGAGDQVAVIFTVEHAKSQEFTSEGRAPQAVERYVDPSMPAQFGMSKQYALPDGAPRDKTLLPCRTDERQ